MKLIIFAMIISGSIIALANTSDIQKDNNTQKLAKIVKNDVALLQADQDQLLNSLNQLNTLTDADKANLESNQDLVTADKNLSVYNESL